MLWCNIFSASAVGVPSYSVSYVTEWFLLKIRRILPWLKGLFRVHCYRVTHLLVDLGRVDLDLGCSTGRWAVLQLRCCPSKTVEHPKSKSTQPSPRGDGSHCSLTLTVRSLLDLLVIVKDERINLKLEMIVLRTMHCTAHHYLRWNETALQPSRPFSLTSKFEHCTVYFDVELIRRRVGSKWGLAESINFIYWCVLS